MARVDAAPAKIGNRRRCRGMRHSALNLSLLSALPLLTTAQQSAQCISLRGSRLCPAFNSSSVSTTKSLLDNFPFLQFVSDTQSFDDQLDSYVKTGYVQARYVGRFGCRGVDLGNSSSMYARWTTTVLCSSMVQMSASPCGLSADASKPICADSCAEFAQSEAAITSNSNLCSSPNEDLDDLIRADYTICGLPVKSLTGDCVSGSQNEVENCGFGSSTLGLCGYCAAGGTNSTDTCCYNSQAESRCQGVRLPTIVPSVSLTTSTATSTPSTSAPTSTSTNDSDNGGASSAGSHLSGGAIAGIVVGVLAGIALLALLILFCLRRWRRCRADSSQAGSIFNQPSPARKMTPAMAQPHGAPQGYEVLPGGRIARMSALEGHSGGSPSQHNKSLSTTAGGTGTRPDSRKAVDLSSSDEYVDSPEYEHRNAGLRPPPMAAARRHGSLSSGSALGSDGQMSPGSGGFSSPQGGFGSQQSEQLPFFKDYYSQDDIHPGDRVAVLWAYSPRAADEFALERGDMIKVVGIWDDGWATGHMQDQRAEDWESARAAQRDSGVSNSSGRDQSESPPDAPAHEMKAFPLVCVCLPQQWRKTIEGDGSTESGSIGHAGPAGPTGPAAGQVV